MALQNQYGLGYSPLSIKNAPDYAYVEESVANKEVGLYGIVVDEDKRVMSAQYVARSKYQLESFVNRLVGDNTIGKLWKITPDDMLVRTIQNSDTNLVETLEDQINNGTNRIKGVRFSIDLDWIVKTRSALKYTGTINVKIGMTLRIGTFSVRQIIRDNITTVNTTAYALDYTGLERAVGDVILTIDEITIVPPDNFDFDENVLALYDILMCTIPMSGE